MAPPLVRLTDPKMPCSSRSTISPDRFGASAQPTVNPVNPTQPTPCTSFRPCSSDSGAKSTGPNARPRMKTVTTKDDRAELSEPNCSISFGTPGANMDDERPTRKVKALTTQMWDHRRRVGQFMGFRGSSGPSQVTRLGSSDGPWCEDRRERRCSRSEAVLVSVRWTYGSSAASTSLHWSIPGFSLSTVLGGSTEMHFSRPLGRRSRRMERRGSRVAMYSSRLRRRVMIDPWSSTDLGYTAGSMAY